MRTQNQQHRKRRPSAIAPARNGRGNDQRGRMVNGGNAEQDGLSLRNRDFAISTLPAQRFDEPTHTKHNDCGIREHGD